MAFVLSGQVQLRPPSSASLNAITNSVTSALKNVNANIAINVPPIAQRQLQTINKELAKTSKEAQKAESSLFNFGKQAGIAVQRFFAFTAATTAFFGFTRSVARGIKDAIEFEREMIKLRQVTNTSMKDLKGLNDEINKLATTFGVSARKILDVGVVLAQAGLNARQTKIALEALAKSDLAPSFDDMASTAEAAIAVFQQFKIKAEDLESVLGSINAVSAKFAVEASDISAVIRRTGGAFAAAGGNLNELIALFTSVRQTTRESAESIATGFRTIFTRIQRLRTIDFLSNLGIQLRDVQGQVVGPLRAIEALSQALSQIRGTDPRFSQIIEELGGFRQVSKVIPLIQQFAVAQKALRVAQQGTNSLSEDAAKAQDALAIKIARTKEQFGSLVREIVGSSAFKGLINLSLNLANALIKVGDSLKGLLPIFSAFAVNAIGRGLNPLFAGARSVFKSNVAGARERGFASGGSVPGAGNSDSVPAMLTPGEFVVRKSAVNKIGVGNLNRLNKGGIAKFADGGLVKRIAVGTLSDGPVPGSKIRRVSQEFVASQLSAAGYTFTPKQLREITLAGKKADEAKINELIDKLAVGGQLSKSQRASKIADVRIGGDAANPTFAGLFLRPGKNKTGGIINSANERFRKFGSLEKAQQTAIETRAKAGGFNVGNSSRVFTNFGLGFIDPGSQKSLRGYIFSLFSKSIAKTVENFGSGIGVSGSNTKVINEIAKRSNLDGVIGGVFEGFVNAVANNVKGGSNDIFDLTGNVNNPGIKKLFGSIAPSIKFADVKGTGDANALKSLAKKSIKVAAKETSLINFIAQGTKDTGSVPSIGEPLKKFASGGLVPGQGNSDSVRANLTPGEFVIRKKAVEAIGVDKLQGINRFAKGGLVTQDELIKEFNESPYRNNIPISYIIRKAAYDDFNLFQPHIPSGSKYLNTGAQAIVLKTPDNHVLRFGEHGIGNSATGKRDVGERPKARQFLQALKTIKAKEIQLEVLPFAQVIKELHSQGKLSTARLERIERAFENHLVSKGVFPFDTHAGNIGRIAVGKTASGRTKHKLQIIDPDVIGFNEDSRRLVVQAAENDEIFSKHSPTNRSRILRLYNLIANNPKFAINRPLKGVQNLPGTLAANPTLGSIGTLQPIAKANGGAVDSVPALLTPGEFVINKQAASKIGLTNLNRLNKADKVQRFATGGPAGNIPNAPDNSGKFIAISIGSTAILGLLQQSESLSDGFKELLNNVTAIGASFFGLKSLLGSIPSLNKSTNKDVIIGKFNEKLNTELASGREAKERIKTANAPAQLKDLRDQQKASADKQIQLRKNAAQASAFGQTAAVQKFNQLFVKEAILQQDIITKRRGILKALNDDEKIIKNSVTTSKQLLQERRTALAKAEKLNKIGENVTNFGLVAASTATIGGSFFSNRGSTEIRNTGGATGSGQVQLGGALSGAGTGAIVGLGVGQLGGPVGAAIGVVAGGAIGGIVGFVDALKKAAREVENIKFERLFNTTTDTLDRALSGKQSPNSSLFSARFIAKSFDDRLLTAEGEDFETALGQRKEFAEKLQVILDNIAKGSSTFEDFIIKLGGNDKADVLFKSLSKTIGISSKDLTQEFKTLIKTTSETIKVTQNINAAKEQEFNRLRFLGDLNSNIERASLNLDSAVSDTISGNARISTIGSPGSKGFIDSFKDTLGREGSNFTSEVQQSLRAKDIIGRALVNVRSINPLGGDDIDASSAVLSQLDTFGISDPNVRRKIQTQIADIIGPESKDARFFEDLNENIESVISKITDSLDTVPRAFFDFTGKLISVNNEYLSTQQKRIESEKEIISGLQAIQDIRRNEEEFLAKADNRDLDFTKLLGFNNAKRGAILGGLADGSPVNIGSRISNSNTIIKRNSDLLKTGLKDEVVERKRLTDEIVKETEKVSRLTQVLEFQADVSNKVAIAQSKFDQEFSRRQTKQQFAENFVFSDVGGRRGILRDVASTLVAGRAGDIGAVPASARAGIGSLLDFFKDVPIAALGGRTGSEVKLDLTKAELKKFGFTDDELKGVTNPGDAEATARKEVLAAFAEAEASRTELNKLLIKTNTELKTILETQFKTFLTDLKSTFDDTFKKDASIRSAEFVGSGVKFADVNNAFTELRKLGVKDSVLKNPDELKRLREQIVNVPDALAAQKQLGNITPVLDKANIIKRLDSDITKIGRDAILEKESFRNKLGVNAFDSRFNKDNDRLSLTKDELKIFKRSVESNLLPKVGDELTNTILQDFDKNLNKNFFGDVFTANTVQDKIVESISSVLGTKRDLLVNQIGDSSSLNQFGLRDSSNIPKVIELLAKLPENLDFNSLKSQVDSARTSFEELNAAVNFTTNTFREQVEQNIGRRTATNIRSIGAFKSEGFISASPFVGGFASGGVVPGSGSKDTVGAKLTPGEFIVNKRAAGKNKKLLDKLNNNQKLTLAEAQEFLINHSKGIGLDLAKVGVNLRPEIKNELNSSIGKSGSRFIGKTNSIVVPESGITKRSVLHELGHAIDFKLGGGSLSSRTPGTEANRIGFKFARGSLFNSQLDKAIKSRGLTKPEDIAAFDAEFRGSPSEAFAEAFSIFGAGAGSRRFIKNSGLGSKRGSTFSSLPKNIRDSILARSRARRAERAKRLGLKDSDRFATGRGPFRDTRKNRRLQFLASRGNKLAAATLREEETKVRNRAAGRAAIDDAILREKAKPFIREIGSSFGTSGFLPFTDGGAVPAITTPGELVFGPSAAAKVGFDNLNKLNSIGKVPGVGNRDSVASNLAKGSFVLNKRASELIQRETGGAVGAVKNVSNQVRNIISNTTSAINETAIQKFSAAITNFSSMATKLTKALNDMPREISFVGRMSHDVQIFGAEAAANSIRGQLSVAFHQLVTDIVSKAVTELKKDLGTQNA